jgi:thiamine biosynthesis protein ThiS
VISVNGKPVELEPDDTVSTLLSRLGFHGRYTLVERNGEPVERARYERLRLRDGDQLVVARPVAGG